MIDEYNNLRSISEEFIKLTSAKRNNRNDPNPVYPVWFCETCVYYPPSACDGKPCCMCNPAEPMFDCYEEKEGF